MRRGRMLQARLGLGGLAVLALVAVPATALAHGAPPPAPTFPDVLLAWSFDPLPLVGVGVAALAYLRAVREVNARHPRSPVSPLRAAAFLGGLAAILLALQSPIDRYETALLSVHMVQHMLLQFVAAPLLLLGAPITLALRVTSGASRRLLLRLLHSRFTRVATHPVVAWTIFVAFNWGWQFSPLYDLALESTIVHYLQHASYLASALLFWWPIAGVDPAPRKLAYPGRAAYLALAIPPNSFLGVTLMSTNPSLYPHYATLARDWGPTLVEDLNMAGAVMWGMGAMVFVVALLLSVAAWMRADERRVRRVEARPEARAAAAAAAEAYHAARAERRKPLKGRGR